MNRKRIMKRMLKHFGIRLPVKFFSDYAVELDPDTYQPIKVFVQHPDTNPQGANAKILFAQDEWTKKYLASHNLKMSYHAFAILHELGHLMSEQRSGKEYQTDLTTLEAFFSNNLIDEEAYINFYNQIEDEENANKWAINWIKSNKKMANWLNSTMN